MNIKLDSTIEYIKSDLYRYTGRVSFRLFVVHFFRNPSFRYTFWLRLTRTKNTFIRMIAKIMHSHLSMKYGIEIRPLTTIGYGLYIGHHMGIVINPTAIIGNNCNLSQFTTIGCNHGKAASIGDNVYIGPSVCIVEAVNIGGNSTIGAGAIVVKDVPENATVAGCPARVISTKTPGRYINHKWPIRYT